MSDSETVEDLWTSVRRFIPADSLADAANEFADVLEDAGVDPNLIELAETLMGDCIDV